MKSNLLVRWGILAGIAILQVALLVGVRTWTNQRIAGIEDDLFAREAPQLKARAELFLNQAYLAIRSIGQMRPVREIRGGNRASESEDPVREGRFSGEGAFAVQQLYNHIASTIPVSEIYCVLTGFRPEAGEIPLFTYDHLITGDGASASKINGTVASDDEPEELESQEYEAYVDQLRKFHDNATDTSGDAEELLALSSGPLRTCDNAQYPSKSKGDVHNAEGFVYSAPVQAPDGSLRGLISAVFRSAAIEAYLLNVPFLPLTHQDTLRQVVAGFTLPDTLRSVLSHPGENYFVGDRRDTAMLRAVRSARGEEVAGMRRIRLAAKDASPWFLYWRADMEPIRAARRVGWIVAGLLSALLWVAGWTLKGWWTNLRRQAIHEQVSLSSRKVLEDARSLKRSGGSLQEAQQKAVTVAQDVRGQAGAIRSHLGGLSASSTEMAASAEEVAQGAADAARLGGNAEHAAQSIADHVDQLSISGKEVARSVSLIAEVADQIKLLSLNATLEAARAGAAGRGFSVVAAEIRSLADHTTMATDSIDQVVKRIQDDIASTAGAARKVVDSLSTVVKSQERIAASAEQQRSTASEVARAAEESVFLAGGIESAMREAEESAKAAQTLATETVDRSASIMSSAHDLDAVATHAAKGSVDG